VQADSEQARRTAEALLPHGLNPNAFSLTDALSGWRDFDANAAFSMMADARMGEVAGPSNGLMPELAFAKRHLDPGTQTSALNELAFGHGQLQPTPSTASIFDAPTSSDVNEVDARADGRMKIHGLTATEACRDPLLRAAAARLTGHEAIQAEHLLREAARLESALEVLQQQHLTRRMNDVHWLDGVMKPIQESLIACAAVRLRSTPSTTGTGASGGGVNTDPSPPTPLSPEHTSSSGWTQGRPNPPTSHEGSAPPRPGHSGSSSWQWESLSVGKKRSSDGTTKLATLCTGGAAPLSPSSLALSNGAPEALCNGSIDALSEGSPPALSNSSPIALSNGSLDADASIDALPEAALAAVMAAMMSRLPAHRS